MRLSTSGLLLVGAAVLESAQAHSTTTTCWETKTTATTPAAASAWSVYRPPTDTETVWKEKTVYNTVYSTVTAKEVVTTTVVSTKYENVPTTIISTKTEPVTIYVTTANVVTNQNTVTQVNTIVQQNTLTQVNTVTNQNTVTQVDTRVQTNTAVSIQYSTVTITDFRPTTVTAACIPTTTTTTKSLTGLVTCPSRIINPTYTPPTPLPSNYLWGCPPGYICQPKQENCNFEQNPPARSYICSPEQCKKAGPLPSLEEYLKLASRGGKDCAKVPAFPGYFNLNPIPWGLSFSIFNVSGQATCPAETSWSTWSKPTQQSSTQIPQSTWATWSVLHTQSSSSSTAPSQWNQWSVKSESTSPTPVASHSHWGQWNDLPRSVSLTPDSHTTPSAPQVTPLAVLMKRAKYYPGACYYQCNKANLEAQRLHDDLVQLCAPGGAFAVAVSAASACSVASLTSGDLVQLPDLDGAFAACPLIIPRTMMPRSSAAAEVSLVPSETTPAIRMSVATGTVSSSASPVISPSSENAAATSSATASSAAATMTPARSIGNRDISLRSLSVWAGVVFSLLNLVLFM